MPHMEPLNIIKNYYGEKYGLYYAFLAHHIGMLCLLTPPALIIGFYQLGISYYLRTTTGIGL